MDKCQMTEAIIAAKLGKSLSWEQIAERIGMSPVWTMHIDKVEDPKGDRVKITMNGKFLPYKSW